MNNSLFINQCSPFPKELMPLSRLLALIALSLGSVLSSAEDPVRMVPGPSAGANQTLAPGEIRQFWVEFQGAPAPANPAISWTLTGPGLMLPEPEGGLRAEFRAPRGGGSVTTLTATSMTDPSLQVRFTLTVSANPAPKAPASVNLMPMLTHVPEERYQGSCSNCYAWAATAAIEVELARRYGIRDRLSIQYFNQVYRPMQGDAPADPCCPNSFSAVLEHYKLLQRMVPWSNPHAAFQEAGRRCGAPPGALPIIGLLPNYPVTDLTSCQIETRLWTDEEVIEELKHRLHQQKAIISKLNSHYVAFIGYDATSPDPLAHTWLVLDSGGVTPAKPDATYRLAMRPRAYDLSTEPGQSAYQFDFIDGLELNLPALAPPPVEVTPPLAHVAAGQPLELVAHVGGRPPVTYQWEKDGQPLAGRTGSVLSLDAGQAGDAGAYAVRVANAAGSTLSLLVPVSVSLQGQPALAILPGTATLGEGTARTFRAQVTGLADARVAWTVTGGGRLEDPTANPVTFWAPVPAAPCTLKAQTLAEPRLAATLPIQVKTADLNGDGVLDVLDLALLAQAYGRTRGDQHFLEAADLNGDGQVDDADAAALLARLEAQP